MERLRRVMRRVGLALVAAGLLLASLLPVEAAFPAKPVEMTVLFGAGRTCWPASWPRSRPRTSGSPSWS
jgi:hypothetical protein